MAQARYVCANCKRRKKRCDKLLPHCTQCQELGAECIYSPYPDTTDTADEIQSIQSRLTRLESYLPRNAPPYATLNDPADTSNSTSLPARLLQPPPAPISLSSDDPTNDARRYLAALISSINHSEGSEVTERDICRIYFTHVSKWLPILSQKKFYRHLDASIPWRLETVLLLLCMYLLVKEPPRIDEEDKYYREASYIYYNLRAESPGSLELAQCALMLATYEHVSGQVDRAYTTMWSCTGMVYSLGLQDKYLSMLEDDEDPVECAEGYSLWWGVLIRGSFISLEDTMRDAFRATPNPKLDNHMPVNIDAWEASDTNVPILERRICDAMTGPLSRYSFSREAQACYLLGEALDVARKESGACNRSTSSSSLQDFLKRLMDPATGTWGTFCGATSMTISSMYELYSNYSPGEDIIAARAKPPVSADAIVFLSSMTQIVTDIADAFNESFSSFNLTAIAPSYPYIMYRAGMQILMSADFPDDKMERNFNAIRKCCWYFSHRWLIAASYLKTLESAAAVLGITLPSFGTFIRPQGNIPGLC